MWKMLLTISGYREQKIEDKRQTKRLLHVFCLCSVLCLLFSVSCAPKHVELPSYEKINIDNAFLEIKKIKSIEAVLSVEYEKNSDIDVSTMSGDASLFVSEDKLNLRLYYLGFLIGEVSEDNGIIKSKPKLDKNKSTILIDGLKNSFLWWNIKDYILEEKEDAYELKNSYRKLLISKKTLLPLQQTIELNDGEELKIFYDAPAKIEGDWYNSRLKIEFKNYIVKIKIKSYSVAR